MLSALTSVFNFFCALLSCFCYFLFGNLEVGYPSDWNNEEIGYYVDCFVMNFSQFFDDENSFITFIHLRSILLLPLGIFVTGSVIGFCKRLMKG